MAGTDFQVQIFSWESSFKIFQPSSKYSEIPSSPHENFIPMTDIKQNKENVKMHLKDLRQDLKKMHLEVTEELLLPKPDDVKDLMNKMDKLLKLIESK